MRSPFSCSVAGVYHYCDESDHGTFEGYIMPEDNPFDANAIGIYRTSDHKLIGYVPKDLTEYVRMWTGNPDKLRCKISLEILPHINIYGGSVTIYDAHCEIDTPFTGKKIYICELFECYSKPAVAAIAESLGATINRALKKDTDFVIYEKSISDLVKSKRDNSGFHFEEIHLYDFIARGLPDDERDTRFFGKEVAFASRRFSQYAWLSERYVIEHGGRFVSRYKEKTTDVLVVWDKWANTVTADKALAAGKTVICVDELLGPDKAKEPKPNRRATTPQTKFSQEITTDEATGLSYRRDMGIESLINPASRSESPYRPATPAARPANRQQSSSGCVTLVAVIIGILAACLFGL